MECCFCCYSTFDFLNIPCICCFEGPQIFENVFRTSPIYHNGGQHHHQLFQPCWWSSRILIIPLRQRLSLLHPLHPQISLNISVCLCKLLLTFMLVSCLLQKEAVDWHPCWVFLMSWRMLHSAVSHYFPNGSSKSVPLHKIRRRRSEFFFLNRPAHGLNLVRQYACIMKWRWLSPLSNTAG